MSDMERAIKVVADWESGNLEWADAFRMLQDCGVIDLNIREVLGSEPEEI